MRRILLTLAALFVFLAVLSPAANAEDAMPPGDQIAAVDQSQGLWYLRNMDGSSSSFYFGNPGDIPLFGDWDGDSEMTPGVYRQSDGRIYLRNSNTQGIADRFFFFGNPGDVPIAGDWDGDGVDTISVFRPASNTFFIINELGANGGGLGAADFSFTFGNPGDIPLAGDWDGDGVDGIAMYRSTTGEFFWRNALSTGPADGSKYYGNPGDNPIAGDWDGDGDDEFGVQRGSTWYREGIAGSIQFGSVGFFPVAGFFSSQIDTGRLNIYETARAAGTFNTLLAAVDAAGLDGALKGPGPLTVFAPTDDAFAALPDGTVEALLNDIPLLTRILQYHVAAGEVDSGAVVGLDGSYAETIGGELVWITVEDGKVILNTDTDKAEVIKVDIKASNGIIHVIDTVLVPKDIPAIAEEAGLTTLLAALEAGDLAEAVSAPNGPFTVFAPTNDAFAALGSDLDELLKPENKEVLQRILKFHVAEGVADAADVIALDGSYIETIGGEIVWISVEDGKVYLNADQKVEVVMTDVKASNGIVHVIKAVMVPKDTAEVAAEAGFSTLVFALGEAGLVDAVKAPNGPRTVFAPTNAAFAAVDEDLLDAVLGDPTGLLTQVLTYHVIEGAILSPTVIALAPGETPATLNGQTISVAEDLTLNAPGDVDLGINGATLGPLDIKTSTGVIHVIDRVLVPVT
jgi:transforming growth factor-beta-induced protein